MKFTDYFEYHVTDIEREHGATMPNREQSFKVFNFVVVEPCRIDMPVWWWAI
jgi:hypothetical protein